MSYLPSLSRSDHEREDRITRLSRKIDRCLAAGMRVQALEYWHQMCAEIATRSPSQVADVDVRHG